MARRRSRQAWFGRFGRVRRDRPDRGARLAAPAWSVYQPDPGGEHGCAL